MADPLIITMGDGQRFPAYNGHALSWSIGLYDTYAERHLGYPRLRAVVHAMMVYSPEPLKREMHLLMRSSMADRMFGHNAKRLLDVVELLVQEFRPVSPISDAIIAGQCWWDQIGMDWYRLIYKRAPDDVEVVGNYRKEVGWGLNWKVAKFTPNPITEKKESYAYNEVTARYSIELHAAEVWVGQDVRP